MQPLGARVWGAWAAEGMLGSSALSHPFSSAAASAGRMKPAAMPAPLPASAQGSASSLAFPKERVSAKGGKPHRAGTPLSRPALPLPQLPNHGWPCCPFFPACSVCGQGRVLGPPSPAAWARFRFTPGRPRVSVLRFARVVGAHRVGAGGCPGSGAEATEVSSRTAAPGRAAGGFPPQQDAGTGRLGEVAGAGG